MNISSLFRDAILNKLKSGQWRSGDRLPTERDLSREFGISRTTVRKVFAEMKKNGLISQTVGSGTYAAKGHAQALNSLTDGTAVRQTSPAELMAARLALEPAIVDLVVGNATANDFDRMQACCDQAEAASSDEAFEHWDGMLHEAIAEAAHNSFVSSVFKLMNQVRAQGEWGLLKKRSLTPERRLAYQDEHRALVAALKERDLLRAQTLTIDHLRHVRKNLLNF